MSIDAVRVAAALRVLAAAIENAPPETAGVPVPTGTPPAAPAATPARRGRGRPVVGETVATTTQAPAQPVVTATQPEADPFASMPPAAAPAPTATLDDVRAALTALRAATTQENALAVLKAASGVDNLTVLAADKYGAVVAAAKAAVPAAPQPAADPFETTAPAAPATKPATLEDVKAECVAAAKRTSQDTVLKVIFDHGGKAPLPTGGEGASLKALPEKQFAAVIAAIKALPSTK